MRDSAFEILLLAGIVVVMMLCITGYHMFVVVRDMAAKQQAVTAELLAKQQAGWRHELELQRDFMRQMLGVWQPRPKKEPETEDPG